MTRELQPLISIIVPCYNQACYLPDALASVLAQTYPHWECIIVNDGSPDNTDEVVREWLAKDRRFKYISKPNGGLSSARNAGIDKAQGEYILPLDADDFISDNYVEFCLDLLLQNTDCKIAYGDAAFFGEKSGRWVLPEYTFASILSGNPIYCTAMFSKQDWELVGGYDQNLIYGYEDWEFWINLLKRGGSVLKTSLCVFHYRIKRDSMVFALATDEYKIAYSRQYIMNKHRKLYEQHNEVFDPFQPIKIQKLELDRLLAERNDQLAERDAQLAERDAQLAERNAQLTELSKVFQTRSWRYTAPIRKLVNWIKKILPSVKNGVG